RAPRRVTRASTATSDATGARALRARWRARSGPLVQGLVAGSLSLAACSACQGPVLAMLGARRRVFARAARLRVAPRRPLTRLRAPLVGGSPHRAQPQELSMTHEHKPRFSFRLYDVSLHALCLIVRVIREIARHDANLGDQGMRAA